MGRRSFLQLVAVAAALPLATRWAAAAGAAARPATPTSGLGRRRLGSLEVSSIGLGCQDFTGTFYDTHPRRADMIQLVRTAHDSGVTFFDAAEAYGPFEVERILGEGVAPFRNQVVITSKFGWNIDQQTGKRLPGLNSRPDHIKQVVDGMLKRLGTDRIDLLYQHRVDPQVPIEEVAGAVKDLMVQGKVLHWGLSEMGPGTLRRAHAANPVTAVQNEYSMIARDSEQEILSLCATLGIGFVAWSPLAMGLLAGGLDEHTRFAPGDFRSQVPWFTPDALPDNLAVVSLLREWGRRKNASCAQIALAWLMAQRPWIVPIQGTTKIPHLLDNLGAANVRFDNEELKTLTASLSSIPIKGARLPDAVLRFSGVEAPLPH
jgi:aryl-alcohol dehydrogenase-like predicted oxidoreductase